MLLASFSVAVDLSELAVSWEQYFIILFPDDNMLLCFFSVNNIYYDIQFQMPSQNLILLFHIEVA